MKKYILFVVFTIAALQANAQLLWKVSGKGLEKPSYILGTHHLAPLSIKDSIQSLPQVMNETAQVYGEVVMADMMNPTTLQTMQQQMMMPQDTTLQSLFTTEQYAAVNEAAQKIFNVELSMLAQLKPAAISQQMTIMLYLKEIPGYNPQEQLDGYFQQQATAAGKKVGGLESVQSQIDVLFNQQSLKRQATLLHCSAVNMERDLLQIKELTAAYMKQDLEELQRIMEQRHNDSCDPLPGETEALIDNRNKAWVAQIPTIISETPTLFVVGAGHLPGENGVLNLLKANGYTVEAMK